MRAEQLVAPFRFEKVEVSAPAGDSLKAGEVLLRVIATGICRSDLPYFKGAPFSLAVLQDGRYVNPPGAPLHEVVGKVVASREAFRLAVSPARGQMKIVIRT
jgi:L-iditol 2-dehydrogenase